MTHVLEQYPSPEKPPAQWHTQSKMVEPEELWPSGPDVLQSIQEAVQLAEELSSPETESWARRKISDQLIPSLYNARTYVEVGQIDSPEIRLGLSRAAMVASDLADNDPRYAPLFSRLRVLKEDAAQAARAG